MPDPLANPPHCRSAEALARQSRGYEEVEAHQKRLETAERKIERALKRVEPSEANERQVRTLNLALMAPAAHMVFRSGYPGRFGGNMDYNRLTEGVTLYLPVSQPGALLFLGDGHAAQGDGELTGNALETSMDIEFSVDVMPRKSPGMPRAEDDEFLMAMGIAGSLTEGLQELVIHGPRQDRKSTRLNSSH